MPSCQPLSLSIYSIKANSIQIMDVKLPKLGEGSESGVVVSILVKEGDTVVKGQTVVELENEKAVAPIPASAAGKVTRIRVKEGDKVSVGQILFSMEEDGETTSSPATQGKTASTATVKPDATPVSQSTAAPTPEPSMESEIINSNPAAAPSIRKIARELGIDLTRIRGSEHGGRIAMADLRAYVDRLQKLAFVPKAAPGRNDKSPVESIDFSQWGAVSRKALTPLRKIISRRMCENWTTIPHVTQFEEADITHLLDLRRRVAPQYEAKGARLTLTPLVIRALVSTLKKHPLFNASIDDVLEEVVLKHYYHVGVAVDTEAGLIVPVIRDADKKSLLQLSKELEELAAKARERKVSGEELKGGTFTISNQGGIGGGFFTPIINKPEVAILGLGRGTQKPAVVGNNVEIRTLLPIALSYDHRLIDGGSAARFIVEFVQNLTSTNENDLNLAS